MKIRLETPISHKSLVFLDRLDYLRKIHTEPRWKWVTFNRVMNETRVKCVDVLYKKYE